MKKLRFYFALWMAKAVRLAMRLLGRNASYLPGKLAVKLCPDFLAHIHPPKTVIAVTGTNGKTTVSNLLTSLLRKNGYTVANNALGSNIQGGVVAALLENATLSGRVRTDAAVLEVDERSSLLVYGDLKPNYLVCTNVMRDSIKRNAHPGFIRYLLDKAIPAGTKLILNADDLICAELAPQCAERTYFGIQAEAPGGAPNLEGLDLVYCPHCGGKLEAEYLRYDHIGRMRCPGCGHASPAPDFLVTEICREAGTVTIAQDGQPQTYKLLNDNIVNIYNQCCVVAVLSRLGLSPEKVAAGLDTVEIVKSRYDHVESGGLKITMQSAKGQNPDACARSFQYVADQPGENKVVFFLIDDKGDSQGSSENPCWVYDCDYSPLAHPSISQLVFSGPRCLDQQLRALIAGVPQEKIALWPSFQGGGHLVDTEKCRDIYILYDVYLDKEALSVKKTLLEKEAGK